MSSSFLIKNILLNTNSEKLSKANSLCSDVKPLAKRNIHNYDSYQDAIQNDDCLSTNDDNIMSKNRAFYLEAHPYCNYFNIYKTNPIIKNERDHSYNIDEHDLGSYVLNRNLYNTEVILESKNKSSQRNLEYGKTPDLYHPLSPNVNFNSNKTNNYGVFYSYCFPNNDKSINQNLSEAIDSTNIQQNYIEPHQKGISDVWIENFLKSRKRRKMRTAFTSYQLKELELRFQIQKYLSPFDRDELSGKLNLHPNQIITWFQNRRAKSKKYLNR
ncbi:retinal homeobox protein Rx-like [Gordionus sp. m RMFG-2023]|uniref:retinal homeobox protein Rx-like n=1 Tax=Gordionus sp. m RMFG-2023 TaxID=3053472 RepID=UPI0031FC9036